VVKNLEKIGLTWFLGYKEAKKLLSIKVETAPESLNKTRIDIKTFVGSQENRDFRPPENITAQVTFIRDSRTLRGMFEAVCLCRDDSTDV
jgi:hypothetical protein